MNGISPLNYRPVTPEKERRAMIFVKGVFILFFVGVLLYFTFR